MIKFNYSNTEEVNGMKEIFRVQTLFELNDADKRELQKKSFRGCKAPGKTKSRVNRKV